MKSNLNGISFVDTSVSLVVQEFTASAIVIGFVTLVYGGDGEARTQISSEPKDCTATMAPSRWSGHPPQRKKARMSWATGRGSSKA